MGVMKKHEIGALRNAVERIVKILSGQKIPVTQRGSNAFVQYDEKTGQRPVRVNIPVIPDDASPELIMAIQGFIDHECGHLLFSRGHDAVRLDDLTPVKKALWNIIEDVRIEKLMRRKFFGSDYNLNRVCDFLIDGLMRENIQKGLAIAKDIDSPVPLINSALVAVYRAAGGQLPFKELLAESAEYGEVLAPFYNVMGDDFEKEVLRIETPDDVLELTERHYGKLKKLMEDLAPPPPLPPQPGEEECESDSPKDDDDEQSQGQDGGEPNSEEDSQNGEGEKDDDTEQASEAEEDSDDDDSNSSGEPEGDDEGSEEPGADDGSDQTGDGNIDGESSEKDADADGNDAEMGEEAEDQGEEDETPGKSSNDESLNDSEDEAEVGTEAEGDSDGDQSDESGDGTPESGGGSGSDEKQEELYQEEAPQDGDDAGQGYTDRMVEEEFEGLTSNEFDNLMEAIISQEVTKEQLDSEYVPYSRDFDEIDFLPTDHKFPDDATAKLEDSTRHMTGLLQKELERMMAARNRSAKVPGFRSGKLHGSSLHRVVAGDDRVFRRKHEIKTKATAVTLLVDNSGSMSGPKFDLAMLSAFALCAALTKINVPCEVLGFTTGFKWVGSGGGYMRGTRDYRKYDRWFREMAGEMVGQQDKTGVEYHRFEPIWMPIFKNFDEQFGLKQRERIACAKYRPYLMGNVDGESIRYAAHRLMQRQEERKVMIVLSDGQPAFTSVKRAPEADLKRAVADVQRLGVETIGIGIMSNAVETFYDNYAVLHNASELPTEIMRQLKKILLQ